MFELYPIQKSAITKTRDQIRQGIKRPLIVSPTGCLAGNTMIGINRAGKGFKIRLDTLVEMMNGGRYRGRRKFTWDENIQTRARARQDNGSVGLVEITAAYRSGKKKVYAMTTKCGKSVVATIDHKFLTQDGWKPLRDITIGDSVYVEEGNRPTKKTKKKSKIQYLVKIAKLHPQASRRNIKKSSSGYTVPTHRLVFEAQMNNLTLKEYVSALNSDKDIPNLCFLGSSLHVHHVDGNSKNNSIDNLVACTRAEHNKYHEEEAINNIAVRTVLSDVESISYAGEVETYDLSMAGPNNFIANGIVVHNSGKTVIASHIIDSAVAKGSRVIFIAHRKEIIDQTAAKLKDMNIEHGIIMSGHRPSASQEVYVASIQTLVRRDFPSADIIIFDEAHHVSAATYQRIVDAYPKAIILGLTATPCRADGKGLGSTFGSIVHVAQMRELIDLGYLVPSVVYAPSKPDLGGVHIRKGDYDAAELAGVVDRPKLVGDIVEHWQKLASDRQTIVFATSIAHSHHLVEEFRNSGVSCEHIDGETDKRVREGVLSRLASGQTRVVCNVGVLTEGYDNPIVSCVVLARPTKSFGLYLQMAGRGLRPAPGKKDLLLLDHAGAVYEHGMVDQDIEWSLDKSNQAATRKKYEKRELMPWTCGYCHNVNPPSRLKHCARCGLETLPEAKSPAIGDGMLEKIDKAQRKYKSSDDKSRFWTECVYKARALDLKIGAAAHMYRKNTGVWPHSSFPYHPRGKGEWQMKAKDFLDKYLEDVRVPT